MNKKTTLVRVIVYFVIFAILFFMFNIVYDNIKTQRYFKIDFESKNAGEKPFELFYTFSDTEEFSQEKSFCEMTGDNKFKTDAQREVDDQMYNKFRVDLGDNENAQIKIRSIEYCYNNNVMRISADRIMELEMNDLEVEDVNKDEITLKSIGRDPYIVVSKIVTEKIHKTNYKLSVAISLIVLVFIYKFVKLRGIYSALRGLFDERKLIFRLSVNDFKTRFAGSYFGIVWAYVQPICTIVVFWFVFQVGFRNPDVGNVQYILWFMTGLIPWFFFSEAWSSATNAFMEYSYLVKKVVFKINILPIIKIISAFFIHLFFILFMIVVYMYYRRFPNVYYLQLIYYMIALVAALSFITAPIIIFFRDLGNIIGIVLQFGMWLTPIMWNIDTMDISDKIKLLFKLNPMYYIVQGYRDCMIYNRLFYEHIILTVYFWIVVIVLSVVGSFVYKRLKLHFADVL